MSVVLYEGPSLLDGKPIVVLATWAPEPKANEKTGDMVQVHILSATEPPSTSVKEGNDTAFCGGCPLRQSVGGACYVQWGKGPDSAWKAWKRNGHDKGEANRLLNLAKIKGLRLGASGDPGAVPWLSTMWSWAAQSKFVTGYTETWRTLGDVQATENPLERYCMASCQSREDAVLAQSLGWKTFRVSGTEEDLDDQVGLEIRCPSDKVAEGESIRKCNACRLCNGRKANVSILVHGALKGRF